MRSTAALLLLALLTAGCDIYIVDSPGGMPTRVSWITTPGPASPTPVPGTPTPTAFPISSGPTSTATVPAPTSTTQPEPPAQPFVVEIVGCDTGFDVTHGMLEVTNAYATVRNLSGAAVSDACLLLRAIDEDREHPDKQKCVDLLPNDHEVTQKLTVDSTFRTDTAVQVDFSAQGAVLLRVSRESCPDVNLAGGAPGALGLVLPVGH